MLELTRLSLFVRPIGLEPTRRKTPDPKSGASTNFATSAWPIAYGDINAVEAKGGCKVTYFYLNTQIFLCFSLFLRLPYSFWNYSSYPISKIHSPIRGWHKVKFSHHFIQAAGELNIFFMCVGVSVLRLQCGASSLCCLSYRD